MLGKTYFRALLAAGLLLSSVAATASNRYWPDACALMARPGEAPIVVARPQSTTRQHDPRLAGGVAVIIIDDVGNHLRNGRAVVDLPGIINIAVLPYTPHGAALATRAHAVGKEVLLHAPMSNLQHIALGRGALTPQLDETEFRRTLSAAIDNIPFVAGINNHMGSDLTERSRQMHWVMEELLRRKLYFVDSRTSKNTVAAVTAKQMGIPQLSRQIFLDNRRSEAAIDREFQKLLALVKEYSVAVAIGHPYPETIAYLQRALPQLEASGVRLVTVSEVLASEALTAALHKATPQKVATVAAKAVKKLPKKRL